MSDFSILALSVWIVLILYSLLSFGIMWFWPKPRKLLFRLTLIASLAAAFAGFIFLSYVLIVTRQSPNYMLIFWIIIVNASNWMLVFGVRKMQLRIWPEPFRGEM